MLIYKNLHLNTNLILMSEKNTKTADSCKCSYIFITFYENC